MLSITVVRGLTTTSNNTMLISKAKTLLVAIDKINATSTISLNRLSNLDYEKKNTAEQQYSLANTLASEAQGLVQLGYYERAISKALEAMKLFKGVLEVTTGVSENDSAASILLVEKIRALKDAINRTYAYLRDVESLAIQAKAQGYNTTEIMKVITEVKSYLRNGLAKLNESNVNDATQYASKVKVLLEKLASLQNTLSKQMKLVRLGKYVIQAKVRVVALRDNITAVTAKLPAPVVSSSLTTLNQAQASLTAADTYYTNGMIKETVDELVNFREKELETISILKAANVTVSSVDSIKAP